MWLILCLTCTINYGTLSFTFSELIASQPKAIQKDEISWAFDYLSETLEGVEKPQILPDGFRITFPKDTYEGWAVKNNNHGLDWWTEPVPIGGTILVKEDWTIGNIKDRSILVHEAAHILDMKTAAGARCDPYYIQYVYLLENGYSLEQIKILYHFTMHDPSRKCHLKIKDKQ